MFKKTHVINLNKIAWNKWTTGY